MLRSGSLVIVHLVNPTEKLWGVLLSFGMPGITLRALNVSSFDDWMGQAVKGEEQTLGLSTMFVPLFRIERIFLDESIGAVESYAERFRKRVGVDVERYLGVEDDALGEEPRTKPS